MFLFSNKASAGDYCSTYGYTVLFVNGMLTTEEQALANKNTLAYILPKNFNGEKVKVDYIYNPKHLNGFLDLIDVVNQGIFNQDEDLDLVTMLESARYKIETQKVLFVAHSQGNFYANTFFEKLSKSKDGIPKESMAVYGVASPDSYVAGGGRYITSDTDGIILGLVARVKNILPPNVHIDLSKEPDSDGHSFSGIYLKYKGEKISKDIQYSLSKLRNNKVQLENSECIVVDKKNFFESIAISVVNLSDIFVEKALEFLDPSLEVSTKIVNTIIDFFIKNKTDLSSTAMLSVEDTGSDENVFTENEKTTNTEEDVYYFEENKEEYKKEEVMEDILVFNDELKEEEEPKVVYKDDDDDKKTSGGSSGGGHSSNDEENDNNNPTNDTSNASSTQAIVDTTPPVITLLGEQNLSVFLGFPYEEKGATAFDAKDGSRPVKITGSVDTSEVGTYVVIYEAEDLSLNKASVSRFVNVIKGDRKMTSYIAVPNSGENAGDGINPNRGRLDLTNMNFKVVYTDTGGVSPKKIVVNIFTEGEKNFVVSERLDQIQKGGNTSSDGDYTNGEIFQKDIVLSKEDSYVYEFKMTDKYGNDFELKDLTNNFRFTIIPSTYRFLPKYTFGVNNGDGNDWQVWAFNGSYIYDWTDTYVDNYLREHFKIKTTRGFYCSNCLQRGIFKHDPQKGFEKEDFYTSSLENNVQNKMNDLIYDVVINWDATGYTYTISHDNIVDYTGHTEVSNMNKNLWVAWGSSYDKFEVFPSGRWAGVVSYAPLGMTGGSNMLVRPYPVYSEVGSPYSDIDDIDNGGDIGGDIGDEDPPSGSGGLGISDYTLNGLKVDVEINPTVNNLNINLTSNKNVNWLSIKIENESDTNIYKIFQSGVGCLDGTNSCSKVWDGAISGGGPLVDGVYRIKVHIKDELLNDFEDYLISKIIVKQ